MSPQQGEMRGELEGAVVPRESGVVRVDRGAPAERERLGGARLAALLLLTLVYGFAMGLSLGTLFKGPHVHTTVASLRVAPPRARVAPSVPVAAPSAAPSAPVVEVAAPAVIAPRAADAVAPADDGALPWSTVQATMNAHSGRIRDCMVRARGDGPLRAGRVPVTVVVAPTGAVRNAGYGAVDPTQVRALGCITSAIKRWRFPATSATRSRVVIIPFDLR